MNDPRLNGLVLREVLMFSPPGSSFRKSDYPWAVAVRMFLKGGAAAKPDGSAGDDGYAILEIYAVPEPGELDTAERMRLDDYQFSIGQNGTAVYVERSAGGGSGGGSGGGLSA